MGMQLSDTLGSLDSMEQLKLLAVTRSLGADNLPGMRELAGDIDAALACMRSLTVREILGAAETKLGGDLLGDVAVEMREAVQRVESMLN